VLCFRLHFTKESPAVINTAGATVRQLVALVFERVLHEDEELNEQTKDCSSGNNDSKYHQNGADSTVLPPDQKQQTIKTVPLHQHHQYNGSNISSDFSSAIDALGPCASDAYLMFQVFSIIINFILFCI